MNTKLIELLGLTLTCIVGKEGDDEIIFTTSCGQTFIMHHDQDCCESVYVDDIVGDLSDLIGWPILKAEESVSYDTFPIKGNRSADESFTWTFYHLATINGYVDIKWLGSSNGYYSESVYFDKKQL
ncbi:MAG: hypothetical protein [Cryophage ML09]|nr:MAG: hypothetical protein [Cryophage ML09]